MEKYWTKNYPPGVASDINPDAYTSLSALLFETCRKYATKPAFKSLGTELTYQQLLEKSEYFAAYLQKNLKLSKGDRLAIMLPNLLQYPIVMLAALRIGLVVVNVNPLYTERELLFPLQDSNAKAIVLLANFTQRVANVISKTDIEHVIVTELGDELGVYKKLFINYYLKYIKKLFPPSTGFSFIKYNQILKRGEQIKLNPVTILPGDIAFLQYTGGTTGKPKGAILSHRNIVANILQCTAWISDQLEEGKEIIVTALPLYHIFSLTICCLAFIKLGGMSLLIADPRNLNSFIWQLKKVPFTVFVGVNTLYQELLKHPKFNRLSFASLKLTVAGGMLVSKDVAKKWQVATKKCIIMGYGLTEASPVVTINPLTETMFTGSIGLPLPSTEVAIKDDYGTSVEVNSPGELWVKGPQVMQGYWRQPDETSAVLDEFGWLRTGDIARMDEQGYIYLIDRKKDMILVSGFNVYPNEIEEVIASHPGVAEVAVIGVPDIQSGEIVKAYIIKKDEKLTEENILKYCKERLTGYKLPRSIEFRDNLPKSNVGKVLKEKLRNQG